MMYTTFVAFDVVTAAAYQGLVPRDKATARRAFSAEVADLAALMFTQETEEPSGLESELRAIVEGAPGDRVLGALVAQDYWFDPRTGSWHCSGSWTLEQAEAPLTVTQTVAGVELTATYRVGQTHESDELV